MSVFTMKLLAMLAMLIDHAGYVLGCIGLTELPTYILMRSVGRPAFPVFAFLIVNGLEKSSDRKRYLKRLSLFALVSQIPFSITIEAANYGSSLMGRTSISFALSAPLDMLLLAAALVGLVLFFGKKSAVPCMAMLLPFLRLRVAGVQLLGESSNVFYTLALGLGLLWLLQELKDNFRAKAFKLAGAALLWLCTALLIAPAADYGWHGIALMAAIWLCRGSKAAQLASMALWCVWMYLDSASMTGLCFTLGGLLALLPAALYNGQPGRRVKLGFYAFYPLHLLLLHILGMALSRM